MKLKLITLALVIATGPAFAAMGTTEIPTFAGQAAAREAARNQLPRTPEEWLTRMTDFTRNASAFKDPKAFVPWANAVTEPSFYIAMMSGMMDPGGWLNMMNSMAHPDAVRNLVQFGDPNIYLKWTAASLDPNFYTALLTQLSDPGKLMRWAMAPVDPKLWNLLLSPLNPNTYIRWGMSPMDPRAWNLAGTVANPALYTGMAGAIVNPNSYGQGTSNWLTWAPAAPVQGAGSFSMWDPVAMLGNLAGYIPGLNMSSLPTLPNIGLPTFSSTPGLPAPAPIPAPAAQAAKPAAQAMEIAPAPAAQAAQTAPAAKPAEAAPASTVKPVEAKPAEVKPAEVKPAEAAPAAAPAATVPVVAAKPVEGVPAAPAKASAQPAVEVKPVAAVPAKTQEKAAASGPEKVEGKPAAPAPATEAAKPEAKPAQATKAEQPGPNKLILAVDTLFKSGKSGIKDLSKEGKAKLDEVVAKLKGMGQIEQIKVVGHADPTGKAVANQKLSEARAKSIKSYLVAKGVKPNVIMSSGVGDTQTVVQCDKSLVKDELKACHAPNRRVEIEVVTKGK